MKRCAFIAVVVAVSACGKTGLFDLRVPGSDGGQQQLPDGGHEVTPSLHAAISIVPTYAMPPFILDRPSRIEGLLTLSDSDGQVNGTLALVGGSAITSLVAVRGTLSGSTVSLEAGEAGVPQSGSLSWKTFTLELVEGGAGKLTGSWSGYGGDVIDQSELTAQLTAAKDTTGASVSLEPLLDQPYRALLLPTDGVRVRVREPVSEALARASVRLQAGGQTQAAAVSTQPVAGRVTTLEFRPDTWLPFDSEVSVALGGLTDPVGNAIAPDATVHRTVPDPGSMLSNLGFEQGLSGWSRVGRESGPLGVFQGMSPAAGSQQLVVKWDSAVAGWLDVPSSAARLTFSAAVFSEGGLFDARSATVTLYAQGRAPLLAFSAKDQETKSVSCDCPEYGHVIPAARYQVDLSALRGQRVYVVAEARSSYFFGLTQYALVLDDLRVE